MGFVGTFFENVCWIPFDIDKLVDLPAVSGPLDSMCNVWEKLDLEKWKDKAQEIPTVVNSFINKLQRSFASPNQEQSEFECSFMQLTPRKCYSQRVSSARAGITKYAAIYLP